MPAKSAAHSSKRRLKRSRSLEASDVSEPSELPSQSAAAHSPSIAGIVSGKLVQAFERSVGIDIKSAVDPTPAVWIIASASSDSIGLVQSVAIEGQRPGSNPAQGNALGWQTINGKPRKGGTQSVPIMLGCPFPHFPRAFP